jgi:hypothetical protein
MEEFADDPEAGLLKVDLRNAFNLVSRAEVIKWVRESCPILLPYARLVLATDSPLFFNDFDLVCSVGTQQGDPLSPGLFAGALMAVIRRFMNDKLKEVAKRLKLKLFYLDDGVFGCSPADAKRIMAALSSEEAKLAGLFLRPDKCEYYHSKATVVEEGFFPQGMLVESFDKAFIMGVPLGDKEFTEAFLSEKLDKRLPLLAELRFLDPIDAMALLRVCLNTCRIQYYLRTVPAPLIQDTAFRFDGATNRTLTQVCGDVVIPQSSLRAIRMHQRIYAAADLLPFAYDCSRFDFGDLILDCTRFFQTNTFARCLSDVVVPRLAAQLDEEPEDMVPGKTQRVLSSLLARNFFAPSALDTLFPPAERDHWLALVKCNYYEWWRPINSPDLYIFPELRLRPEQQRVMFQYTYLIPYNSNGDVTCAQCNKKIGDNDKEITHHNTVECKGHNHYVELHDNVKDCFAEFGKVANLRLVKEQSGLKGPDSRQRPADILLHNWHGPASAPVAVDVTLSAPGLFLEAEERKFKDVGFFEGMSNEERKKEVLLMREQTGAADVPPRIPTSSLVPEGGDLDDLPYQQLDFCPAAIDHLGNFSPFAMLLARRLAESLADVYHTDSYRSLSYIRRFISRIIAFNLSGRLLASLASSTSPRQEPRQSHAAVTNNAGRRNDLPVLRSSPLRHLWRLLHPSPALLRHLFVCTRDLAPSLQSPRLRLRPRPPHPRPLSQLTRHRFP